SKFGKRPMHFFGLWGTLMFLFGTISAFYIGAVKLYRLYAGTKTILVTDNPWFFIALTSMILGTLLFLAGFIGELIIKNKSNEKHYSIKEKLNF
ncbi:MAG: glycosyltransferase, partial [Polaribacter sp.]